MTNQPQNANDREMSKRAAAASEFFVATRAELEPWVSDEATWYDFDYLDDADVLAVMRAHYGAEISADDLRLPFWKFLDHLEERRTSPSR